MTRILYTICIVAFSLCSLAQAAPPEARLPDKHRAFFKAHCFDCHDTETQEGKVDLERLPFRITTLEQAELWQKVLNALNAGEMPPEDSEQPGNDEKADFLDDLAQTMVAARRALSDSGGKITMRRLNRREYRNTIEQLTGVKVDVDSLPTDGGSGTFDTVGASQFISSDQIEQYLKIGRSAIDELFEREAALAQESKVFRVEPETTVNVESRKNMRKMEETYKRYLLWKAEVDKAALLPENEEVLAQLREKYKLDDLTDSVRLYQNANLLKGTPDATKFGFSDANAASFSFQGGYGRTHAYMKHYLELPHSDRGTYLKLAWAIQRIDVTPDPENVPPGTYKLRIRAGTVEGSPASRHFIEIGHPQRVNQVPAGFSSLPLSSHQVTGTVENPEIIETQVEIGINTPREFGIQERRPTDGKNVRNSFFKHKRENGYGTPPAIWVDWIELEGPIKDVELPQSRVHRVEPEKTINPANEKEIEQIEDAYARFTRWQKGVDEAAKSPANQAKIAEIRKTDRLIDHPVRFYAYADRLEGTPNPRDFGFPDSNKAAASHPGGDRANLAYHKHYAALPHRDRGAYLKVAHGTGRVIVSPEDLAPGNYVMRVRAAAVEGSPASRHFIQVGHPQRQIASRNWGLEGRAISSHQVTGTIENPETIEIPLEVGSKTPREFAVQEKQPNNGNLKALWDAHNALKKENGYGHPPAIWIDWVELEGPLPKVDITGSKTYRVEPEKTINPKNERIIKGMEETFERFAQWQKGVDRVASTPENQAIIAEIAKEESKILNPIFFYRYADRLKGTPDATDFGFNDAPNAASANPEMPNGYAYLKHYASLPHRDTGAYLKPTKGTGRVIVSPEKLPIGSYTLRVRVGAVEGSDPSRHFIQIGHPQRQYLNLDWALEGRPISTQQVTGTIQEPQVIEVPIEVRSDTFREFAVQEKQPNNGDMKALWKTYNAAKKKNGYGIPPAIWIDWVELDGPHVASNSGSDKDDWWITNATDSDDSSRARTILEQFAFKAFRGVEADVEFIDRLANIFASRRKAGDSFDTAIRLPLSIILASPGFLYLNEPNDADQRRQLTDRELAVRMAYFLWSAPPDQELLDLAKQQKLSQPEILRQQVDRLITDSRSDEFVSGFVHQWLDMERLDFFQFDTTLHREFDESTRSAARQEVYHSFAHLLRNPEEGHLGKLLKSDHVFVNGLLANYYGIDGVTGDQFQQVSLPEDSPRGGLLGMAAIHAMGSDGIESSPVERGAWVLRHLLNDPPPPAPPNVPQISRLKDQVLTTRERLLAHQEEAQCASCHRKIDPIGFGLENFNAAGKWRTEDSDGSGRQKKTWKIDASGAFHKGPAFGDYQELRDLIAEREDHFARGFTENLIEYSLGRPFGFADEELANEIVSSAKRKQFAMHEFFHAMVQSKSFQTKGRKSNLRADISSFKSHLFEKGTLVYSDDFNGALNQKRWEPRTKKWQVKDGMLIGIPTFKNAQEAQKALGRDHHLDLGPVIRLNKLPEKFVLHMRFKFEGDAFSPARPKFDIGHHINSVNLVEGGHSLILSGGERFTNKESGVKLNEWVDAIIEFKEGELLIEIIGQRQHIKHEQVSMKSRDEITFKALESPESRLLFDYVRIWKVE